MTAETLRKKFIEFFKERGHVELPGSSLVPENDTSVLFTTAGMQQFKPYYLDPKKAPAKNIITIQPCLRTNDIEEVGDETHFTLFEMLGNFSFDGYFKKKTIKWAVEFLEKLDLPRDKFSGHYFGGEGELSADNESLKVLQEIGIKPKKFGRADNFWGPTGDEGPCGPDVELFLNNVETWTLVFNEYYCEADGKLSPLKTKGVDTGAGLERLLMLINEKDDIYKTDLFEPIISEIESNVSAKYEDNKKAFRIIADHIRASVFLLADGVMPSNIGQGYVLRRLIRRLIRYWCLVGGEGPIISELASIIIENYKNRYPRLSQNEPVIIESLQKEEQKFSQALSRGLAEFAKMAKDKEISGQDAFKLYESYGFPLEMTRELVQEKNIKVDEEGFKKASLEHQQKSRTASAGMFKSGLIATSETTTKYHTATHLLLASLRKVLGDQVVQRGSNITEERLRLDFSYTEKLAAEQIQKVEKMVNEKIKEDLKVDEEVMSLADAKRCGALGEFEHKYGINVKVYMMGDFSKEICAGPHVEHTGVLGHFKITKEEASSAGVRRIKAKLE